MTSLSISKDHLRLIFATAFLLSSALFVQAQYDSFESIDIDGVDRTYMVHVPGDSTEGMPVIFNFHGNGVNGQFQFAVSRLQPIADSVGIVVVCPDALWPQQYWTLGDSTFLRVLIDQIIMDYNIDTTRIYSIGHSVGGMVANGMAYDQSYRIAAAAVSAGQLSPIMVGVPEFAVPVMIMHPIVDESILYENALIQRDYWVDANGCSEEADTTIYNDDPLVEILHYGGGDDGSVVTLVTTHAQVYGHGHYWPTEDDAGYPGGAEIWEFLSQFTRGEAVNRVDEEISISQPSTIEILSAYPNPFNGQTIISYEMHAAGDMSLSVHDILGRQVRSTFISNRPVGRFQHLFDGSSLSSGVYLVTLNANGSKFSKKLYLVR